MVDKEYETSLYPYTYSYSTRKWTGSQALMKYSKFASEPNPLWMLRERILRSRSKGEDYLHSQEGSFARGVEDAIVDRWDCGNGKFQIASLRSEPDFIRPVEFSGPGGIAASLNPGNAGLRYGAISSGLKPFWDKYLSAFCPIPSDDQLLSDAISWGAKGLYRANRFKPRAHLATALLELTTLRFNTLEVPHIPMGKFRYALQKGRAHEPMQKYIGQAGGEYLNVVFGWIPTIGDVRALLDSQRNAAYLLDQLQKEEAKPYRFRKEVKVDSFGVVNGHAVGLSDTSSIPWYFKQGGLGAASDSTISGKITVRKWVSGSILSAPLSKGSPADVIRQIDYLYGVVPSPSAIWEAIPFSWLIDWQSNIGDVLSNISSIGIDGIVFNYAYSMINYQFEGVVSDNFTLIGGQRVQFPLKLSLGCRVKASPYGFGLTPEQLNNKQWAILAALGLTKAFGQLP